MVVLLVEFLGVLITLLVLGTIMHLFLVALGCALLLVTIAYLVKAILGGGA